MATIIIDPGGPNCRTAILKEGENTVGRAEDNDICINEGSVSGHHCKIVLNGDQATIVDLNSTNGTLVNGARVSQSVWNTGEIIHLGALPIRLGETGPVTVRVQMTPVAVPVPETPSIPVAKLISSTAPAPPPTLPPKASSPQKGPIRLNVIANANQQPPD